MNALGLIEAPIPRPAARVLLIDERDRILLIKTRLSRGEVWLTPGGGLEEGESYEAGALRELWEETGVAGVTLGPCVWVRSHVYRWADHLYQQQERFFVVRVGDPIITMDNNHDEVEQAMVVSWAWWSLHEIRDSRELFVPGELAIRLEPILAGAYPDPPVVVGP